MSKKIIITIIAIIAIIAIVAAVVFLRPNDSTNENTTDAQNTTVEKNETSANIEGTLEEIMEKLYNGIEQENLPMALSNMEVNEENIEFYLGTADIEYKEALANESMVGSIAHSVVLVRLNDANDASAVVDKIKNNVDPRKWICIEASNVVVKNKGDLVVLIMSNEELAPKLEANFDNL